MFTSLGICLKKSAGVCVGMVKPSTSTRRKWFPCRSQTVKSRNCVLPIILGAMLGKFKKAVIGLPGGCHLGPRPIDQHIKGFEALGAEVTNEQGAIYIRAEELVGARIYLDVV